MFVKTKERAGRKIYYLCISESGGNSGVGWKSVEHMVCVGETLDLSGARWEEILRGSATFRTVPLDDVLEVLEQYLAEHGLPSRLLAGLRAAAHASKWRKTKRNTYTYSDRRSQENERTQALRLLGLPPGSSEKQIEKAFRRAARRLHPDVGGDAAKFRAIVDARDFLLGRSVRPRETA
jgi:hypothetical protein